MSKDYDVIVIGGGPAGLTAAYCLAEYGFRTALFERQSGKGLQDHPCGCMVSPIKGYISFEKQREGMYFREIDFLFPNEMIIAYPRLIEFVSPNGCKFGMRITKQLEDFPVFQIDKKGVLGKLADRAAAAGAELRYGSHVAGLIRENDFVKGVIVDGKYVRSKIVLSAEGLSRKFCNEAGLYESKPLASFFIVAVYLRNLKLNETELGSIGIFGTVFSSLPRASLMFHTLGHDKAMILLSVLLPEYRWPYEKTATYYLEEYISKVPWVNEIYKQGEVAGKKSCWITVQKPTKLVTNGFIGAGDSVAPFGHSSNVIAMLIGKEAAVTASDALWRSDTSAESLYGHNKWLKSKLFSGVEFEAILITSLLNFTDQEINTICDCFSNINLEPFFVGTPRQQMLATLRLVSNSKIVKNWKLIRKFYS